jgi:hypothetical protein
MKSVKLLIIIYQDEQNDPFASYEKEKKMRNLAKD